MKADGPREAVTDKGYHSNDTLQAMAEVQVRSYISEQIAGGVVGKAKPKPRKRCTAIDDASGRARHETAGAARGVARTQLRALVGDGKDAAGVSPRKRECS